VLNSSYTNAATKIEFVCYACNQWSGIDVMNPAHPFIWAKRDGPGVEGVLTESILGIHSQSGEYLIIVGY